MAAKKKVEAAAAPVQAWPADKVERWPVAKLVPDPRNARTHSPEQVAQIAAAIKEWGWTTPILIDEKGSIIAGHGRVQAAKKLGLVDVPVMVARGWSEAQVRAYIIADNRLPENAGWDDTKLAAELKDLQALGFDATLAGFSADQVAAMGFGAPAFGAVREIPVGPVADRFWISVRGPLALQAKALDAVKAAMGVVDGIEVDVGVIQL